jgi:hypothetical protein
MNPLAYNWGTSTGVELPIDLGNNVLSQLAWIRGLKEEKKSASPLVIVFK